MLSKTLTAAVENIGLSVTASHAYGIYGGYLLTVSENGNKKTAFINFLLEDTEENKNATYDITEAIKEKINEYGIVDYSFEEDGMLITTTKPIPEFLKMIDFFIDLLSGYEVKGSNFCSYCGKKIEKGHPRKITKNNKNYLLCGSCALEIIEEHNKPSEASGLVPTVSEKLKGVLGSVLGGLVGVFLFFACYKWLLPLSMKNDSWDLRYIYAALGFVVGYLTYLGYKLLCRKPSLTAYIVVPVVSIVFTAFAQYMGTIIYILNANSLTFSGFPDYKRLFLMPLRSNALEGFTGYSSAFYTFCIISSVLAAASVVIFLTGWREKARPVQEQLVVETLKIKQ